MKFATDLVKEISFKNPKQLIQALRRSNNLWESKGSLDCEWIFRGQADADWELIPSAFRTGGKAHPLIIKSLEKIEKDYPTGSEEWEKIISVFNLSDDKLKDDLFVKRFSEAARYALAHANLIRDFTLLAINVGHSIEMPSFLWHLHNFHEHLSGEQYENQTSLQAWFDGHVIATPFAIAQHHGVPTGLLDWTDNPLIALYFALPKITDIISDNFYKERNIAVWALNREYLRRRFDLIRRYTISPKITPFLDAQEGHFIWMPLAYHYYSMNGTFPSFENSLKTLIELPEYSNLNLPKPALIKLTTPISNAAELLKILWKERITLAHIMPTFDNISNALFINTI